MIAGIDATNGAAATSTPTVFGLEDCMTAFTVGVPGAGSAASL